MRVTLVAATLCIAATLAGPASAGERLGLFQRVRATIDARREMRTLERAAYAHPNNGDYRARAAHARQRYLGQRVALWRHVRYSPLVQLATGAAVDGPKEVLQRVKRHPFRTAAVLVGAAGIATLAGLAGLPIDTISLCASGGLTAYCIGRNWSKVRAAFKRHARDRWREVGEDVVFPATAFAAGVGAGALVEHSVGLAKLGASSNAVGVGLKSTAQSVDDLVPLVQTLGDNASPPEKTAGVDGSR